MLSEEQRLVEVKAKLQAQKRRYEKIKHSQDPQHQLRHHFQSALNKLNNLETRDVAVKEAKAIIHSNISEEALKVFLGSLGEVRKMSSSGAREQEVLLLGFIATVFQVQVPLKHLHRMLEIIQEFFKDSERKVQEAAAEALCQVYLQSVPRNLELILGEVFDPLEITLTSGLNTKAQQASALSICKWLRLLFENREKPVLQEVVPRVVALFLKLRCDFPELVTALESVCDFVGLKYLLQDLFAVLRKVLQYLNLKGAFYQKHKIEACRFLESLAKQLQSQPEFSLEPLQSEILNELYQAKIDKLQSIQNAARSALKEWKSLDNIQKEMDYLKQQEEGVEINQIVEYRTQNSPKNIGPNNFRAIRELAKRKKFESPAEPKEVVPLNINPHVMEVIQRRTDEDMPGPSEPIQTKAQTKFIKRPATAKDTTKEFPKESPQESPKDSKQEFFQLESLKDSLVSMQQAMDKGFNAIERRLYQLDERMDEAYDKLDNLHKPQDTQKSFVHPPVKIDSASAFTQTPREPFKKQPSCENSSEKPQIDPLSKMWLSVLQLLHKNKFQEAYQLVLNSGDDIYLLRLMHKTGVCTNSLCTSTLVQLVSRVGMILNSNFLESIAMDWMHQAHQTGLLSRISGPEKQEITTALQKVAEMPVEQAELASKIYDLIDG